MGHPGILISGIHRRGLTSQVEEAGFALCIVCNPGHGRQRDWVTGHLSPAHLNCCTGWLGKRVVGARTSTGDMESILVTKEGIFYLK